MSEESPSVVITKMAGWISGIFKGNSSRLIPMLATEDSWAIAANEILAGFGHEDKAQEMLNEIGTSHQMRVSALRSALAQLAHHPDYAKRVNEYCAAQEQRHRIDVKSTARGMIPVGAR